MGDIFKNTKRRYFGGGYFFLGGACVRVGGGVSAHISKEGLKSREEPSLQSCADSHGSASTEQEHYAVRGGWRSIIADPWCLLFYKRSSRGGNMQ